MTTILTEIADDKNWRLVDMYDHGEVKTIMIWVGRRDVILKAQEEVEKDAND